MENNYSFSVFNQYCAGGVSRVLGEYNAANRSPIIVCVGSDLVLGDSLGPLVGTLLKQKGVGTYIYGTLNCPITAKEIEYAKTYLKQLHPESFIIAIDAAVGASDDIGLIKLQNKGLRPGLGVNKSLGEIASISSTKWRRKSQKESRIISTNANSCAQSEKEPPKGSFLFAF